MTKKSSIEFTLGFTLVELLVVISIIAILAAVLFPVFAQAKAAAKQSACLSNEKQLALGVILYVNDYDDTLPPDQDDSYVLWPDLINPYVRNAGIRVCQSDAIQESNSYGVNQSIFIDDTDFLPNPPPSIATMTMLARPSSTVMIGEIGSLNDLVTPKPNSYKMVAPDDDEDDPTESRPIARHFNRTNLALFDGHCTSMQLNQFYGTSKGVGSVFTANQTPLDLWFCADPGNPSTCLISN